MIQLDRIAKSFGERKILADLSMTIQENEHLAILAESGIGKTTLLRIIAGLEQPDAGSVTGISPDGLAYMFQEPRLFESLSALDNVAVVSRDRKETARRKAGELLAQVGLEEAVHKHPSQLSGGMKQRVALARTFMTDAAVFLLDEPFSALDEDTREKMRRFVYEQTQDKTLLLVTHRRDDAELLCSRIITLQAP